jgi:hypothetical protein
MNIAGQKERGLLMTLLLVVATAILITGLTSCSHNKNISPDPLKEYRTKTGKTIIISETHPVGRSLSTIRISTKGFEHNYAEVFENKDPISDVFVADLDGNGFDEIYIITTSAGSGSYGTVLGFASNRDKSLSMINFPEIREGDENFEGYMGQDTFKIEDQKLVRVFPIYNPGDTNENPTGGRRKLVYGLYPGEAMWQLKVEKSEHLDTEAEALAQHSRNLEGEARILQSWQGDYPVARLDLLPESQREEAVGYIGGAETFGNVWKAFKPGEAVPEINFQADLVLFARNTHFYNSIRIGKVNVKNGVAEVLAMETMSAMPIEDKVAISLAVVGRQGISGIQIGNEVILVDENRK